MGEYGTELAFAAGLGSLGLEYDCLRNPGIFDELLNLQATSVIARVSHASNSIFAISQAGCLNNFNNVARSCRRLQALRECTFLKEDHLLDSSKSFVPLLFCCWSSAARV